MAMPIERVRKALPERYVIQREIGRGGMATVYLAEDQQLNRQVAIKVLRPELSFTLVAERFKREISIAAKLNHRHIVALYDSGEVDGLLYFVMPFVRGETLRATLDREGPLPLARALGIMRDVSEGLAYAHRVGVVHRDIKPENILLTAEGYAVVADFGVARALQAATGDGITTSGAVIGTAAYMSPEQASGRADVDSRADIYSLGCVLYEMLTAERPFRAESHHAMLIRQIAGTLPSLEKQRPDVPAGVSDVIHRALAKAADHRFSSVTEFAEQLAQTARGARASRAPGVAGWLAWLGQRRRRARLATVLVAAAITSAFAWGFSRRAGSGFTGRPESVVVLPFHTASSNQRDRDLAVELADQVTSELNRWESIVAVPRVSLAGPAFDLGIRGSTLERVEDGVRLARQLSAQALLAVAAHGRGDSAVAEATLFDARTRRAVGRSFQGRGRVVDVGSLIGPIVKGILELDGSRVDLTELRRQSAYPDALRQEIDGRALLERWRLAEAESHFRRAISIDSTFALALHRLAQTLYWQAAQNPNRLSTLGPEITRFSAAAVRHSSGLPARDSTHIKAFYAFQEGDYPTARAAYHAILDRDSTDVYAWLMLGSVEFRDPWLVTGADTVLRPRGNLNTAVRGFSETTRLQPRFDLGYGHLFDIHRRIISAVDRRACRGFELPRVEKLTPWEPGTPHHQRAFCPVVLDSISWLTETEMDTVNRRLALSGAERLLERRLGLLRRWAAYAPEEPKPRRELTTALMEQRARLGVTPPEHLDSLAREALRYGSEALRLARDTVPEDLLRVAALHLASGDVATAISLTERALAAYQSPLPGRPNAPPPFAANVFLAQGQPSRALPLVSAPGRTRFVPDDSTGRLIPYGGADAIVDRLRVLGATRAKAEAVRRELAELEKLWSDARYTPRERRMLRRDAALRIAVALSLDSAALAAWDAGLGLDRPIWRSLVASAVDLPRARAVLPDALSAETPGLSEAARTFLLGLVASRTGEHALAARLFSRLDSIPLATDILEPGWGLRSVAFLMQGATLEALGKPAPALRHYEHFVGLWANADSFTRKGLDEARAAIRRLRSRP